MNQQHSAADRLVVLAFGASLFAGLAGCGGRPATPSVPAPAGADTLRSVEWLRFPGPSGRTLLAAVARPTAPDPRPLLVLLHGTHGFAHEYVTLARDVAREVGVVAVTPCWFAPGGGAGLAFVTPIECPGAPPMPDSSNTPEALAIVDALVDAARALPGVRPDRVALFGHSRGGVAALHYALERGRGSNGLQAIVLNSTAYPPSLLRRAGELGVPILMLHGTEDSPAQGGSPMTAVSRARAFEAALRAAGKAFESHYFEGADHGAFFVDTAQRTQSVRRIHEFLRRHGFE